jgi:hypothetical protein
MPEGEQFLHKKYSDLHTSESVEHEQERKRRKGEEITQKPAEKIADFLEIIKRTHSHHDNPVAMQRIRKYYYKEYVIKLEDIPESYFDNQKRIAREQGHGDIEITKEMRQQLTEVIITDQKSSLDKWVDYLSSEDAAYPQWLKYFAFRNIVSMGDYDKEKKQFTKRSQDTVKPFPDLNREALAYVLDVINKKAKKENIDLSKFNLEEQQKFNQLLQSENFAKLYAWAIEKVTPASKEALTNTKGKWIKYKQGSDHMPLVESLQGHGTGWCTAGESTAQTQLQGGDFYVYYSEDEKGNPNIPRVAIRMQGNSIGEVRGIAPNQNLDPYVNDIVKQKLSEFPDGKLYEKKVSDMKQLTAIENKTNLNQELTKEELSFLYEIKSSINGFGFQKDPRIKEIQQGRSIKKDLAYALDCSKDQISITEKEALKGNIKFHYGGLSLSNLTSAEGLKLPESIGGGLFLDSLTSAEGLKLPESIGGVLYLNNLTSAEGLKLPESIGGSLYLDSLTSAEGLKLPESVGGGLFLDNLTSAKGLKLPESIGGSLFLKSLTSAEGLKLPESVGGGLFLDSLTSAEGLKLPESIGGDLFLKSLTSAEGLKLPESVGGDLFLNNLTSAEKDKLRKQYPNLRII